MEVQVFVEIPNGSNLKYEIEPDTGHVILDRVLSSAMNYPGNYGYIKGTLAKDGDPLDALILAPYSLHPGCYVQCRVVGALVMSDEKGLDEKVLVVPADAVDPHYKEVRDLEDLPVAQLEKIRHFFEYYKHTDQGKWSKVEQFIGAEAASVLVRDYEQPLSGLVGA